VQLPPHLAELNVDVSKNKKVVIKITSPDWDKLAGRYSRKGFYWEVYTGLQVTSWKDKYYLNDRRWKGDRHVVPEGSIVVFGASAGSYKHTYHSYAAVFMVKEGARAEITLEDRVGRDGKESIKLVVENLEPLPMPSASDLRSAEAEILNRGLEISRFVDSKDVLLALYHYYVKQKLYATPAATTTAVAQAPTVAGAEAGQKEVSVEELEKMLQELEKGKETIPVVPTTATAVPSVQAPPPPPPPSRAELVKIYELIMRLPSKYLVQQSKYVKTEAGGVAEQRVWEGLAQQVASRLEGIRRVAYDKIKQLSSFAHVEEFERWIAVTDKAVKDAEELSKWVREELSKLPIKQLRPDVDIDNLYAVKAIEVYLKPEDAKLLLDTAIAELEEAKQELEKRIQQAEQEKKRSVIKKLEQELESTKQVLEQFKKFLQQLESRQIIATTPQQQATAQQQEKKQKKAVAVTS
jgi:hypothetical protein